MSSLATDYSQFQAPTIKSTQAPGGVMKLTRRGRFVFIGLPVLSSIVVVLFMILGALLAPKASASDAEMSSVVVHSGQGLWSVAQSLHYDRDVRDVMQDIIDLNHLSGDSLQPGEKLIVPAY